MSVMEQNEDIDQHMSATSRQAINKGNFNVTEGFRRRVSDVDFEEFLKNASHPLSQMFTLCQFAEKRFPCQSLVSPAATLIGYCFTVNSAEVIQARGEPLLTKASGTNSALHFVSFINQTEYHVGLDGDVTAGIQVSQALLFERDRQAYLFQERAI